MTFPASTNAQRVNFSPMISANPAQNLKEQDISFEYSQSGTAFQVARTALRQELAEIEDSIGRKVVLFTARQDVIGDDTPEVIVKLADKKIFCDSYGNCPIKVFQMSENGPQEIGSFQGKELAVLKPTGQKQRNSSIIYDLQTTAYLPEKQVTRYTIKDGRYVSNDVPEEKPSQGEEKDE